MAAYNPFEDFNPAFTRYEYLEIPEEIEDPLYGTMSISSLFDGISPDGTWIAKSNIPSETTTEKEEVFGKDILDRMASSHAENPIEYSGSIMKLNLTKNKKQAMEFFLSKGLNAFQAAGIVGNLIHESGLNTTIKGDGGKAFGIAQWHPDRQKGLKELAKLRGTDISDFNTLLEYVWQELNSTEKKALDKLLNSKNTLEATMAFMSYERPGNPLFLKRLGYANGLLNG